jgi:hypothetical protein
MSAPSEGDFIHEALAQNSKLSITVRGSQISGERVTGPNSIVYPILRDLADAAAKDARVVIEMGTKTRRVTGAIKSVRPEASSTPEALRIQDTPYRVSVVPLNEVIAFRVLSIKTKTLPFEL